MDPLATITDLKARLEWVPSTDEERLGTSALEELSDDARFYGTDAWTSPGAAPRQVINLVLKAAARFMRNPDGYTQSRAGDETLAWTDRGAEAGSAHFTEREIKQLQQLANRGGLLSVAMSAWDTQPRCSINVGLVPTGGDQSFPFFSSDTDPWWDCPTCGPSACGCA